MKDLNISLNYSHKNYDIIISYSFKLDFKND